MAKGADLFTTRKSLDAICSVPDKIISVYALEQHVWTDSNSPSAIKARRPELRTIEEFQIDPVRPFLNDIFRNIAAPYHPERKDNPIGQGYWIQAEFGSGKSHLLCFLSSLALGSKDAWQIVQEKEKKADRGRRDSLYRFWEEGLEAKNSGGKKGVFVIVKTLVGAGGGIVGLDEKGRRLTDYILEAAKAQLQAELGKNLSLYPTELLADRFLSEDLDRYRADLKKFLKDPTFFNEDEFEEIGDFVRDIQQNKSPEYKRSCGNKLWRFYTDYLKVQPQIVAETEDVLKHLVETILAEGYSGVLLVLDEVSLFMKNRDDDQRYDDEKTLVVLANRLAKVHNLPIWTVCAAQQAIESKMGVKNIIADDRLKLVELLKEDKDYYNIVLSRVREIKDSTAIGNYYLHYKRGFSWPNSIGEEEFRRFFPFHKPAIEVLRYVTYELTTTRSAIHFMHQTLKHQMKNHGCELIRLWELFDEAVRYEEDPSGVHAGLVAIRTKREAEYRSYETCRRQIDSLTKGQLKFHRDKAIKTLQTLFLYHISRTRQQGITPEEIANSVLIERDADANPDENNQHYETLAENLKRELAQVVQTFDEDKRPRYRFEPTSTAIQPRERFQKARDEVEANTSLLYHAWEHLLALDEWPVKTRQMTRDLSNGVRSIFRDIAPFVGSWESGAAKSGDQATELVWQGRQVSGLVGMRDLARAAAENLALPAIDSDQTDRDFAVLVSTRPCTEPQIVKLLAQRKDRRVILWTPDELNVEERELLRDFAAYRKLVDEWQGKETEEAITMVNWVAESLRTDLGRIIKIVNNRYTRGRVDALDNTRMDFHVAGELASIITPLVERVLNAAYESRDVKFDKPFVFRREEAVKVINGIVRTGRIPRNAKPNQDISAAQNFGVGLLVVKKSAEKELDTSGNPYVHGIWEFIDEKLADQGQTMAVETLYKNFMGIGGPKDYGLTKRMVQLYLLCLVQEGRIRVGAGPRSGLSTPTIDYSNIAGIDFSAKILDALTDVQKLEQPENWEVLRPYAEKLLDCPIPSTNDDALISKTRTALLDLFAEEKEKAKRVAERARGVFQAIGSANPYATEVEQLAKLFSADLTGGNDIDLVLFAIKNALGYEAFDTGKVSTTEVDDLANRLRNYRDVARFLEYETDLRTAVAYRDHQLPQLQELRDVRKHLMPLGDKLRDLRGYIDSDLRLKTDLVGHNPPQPNESGTLGALIHTYTTVYTTWHDNALDRLDARRKDLAALQASDDLLALKALEGITALQPAISTEIERNLTELAAGIFTCATPSVASVRGALLSGPLHQCELSFENAARYISSAEAAVVTARALLDNALDQKLTVFLNSAVRERLRQGEKEPAIAALLQCPDLAATRAYLVRAVLADRSIVNTINRYLKRIVVRAVKLAAFKPTVSTIEPGQVDALVREFQKYLEAEFKAIRADGDTLPMIRVE